MRNGRIVIVSDRRDVIAELEPVIRAGKHLSLSVSDGKEALRLLEDGIVPDLMISDTGVERSQDEVDYVRRFREMNQLGRHMVIVEDAEVGSEPSEPDHDAENTTTYISRPFRPQDVETVIMEAISSMDQELVALRAEMWREMDRMRRMMRELQRETIAALANTIAARDSHLAGHAGRVAALCRRVAEAMGVTPSGVERLETAAQLHEIGRIAVPVELLQKTEPLTMAELERIRSHAHTGAEIVRGVPSLRSVAPLIELHGTDFSQLHQYLEADAPEFRLVSILRVVDAYDAMTSPRSYRDPMTPAQSQGILLSHAGERFDPAVVEILLFLLCE